ncbi:hypothetical protein BcepSauron_256 [Burkholderia phage BcepSauron]|uniref:Uncharacterized protein n=2 Tax=Sarumanvirus TaxID=2843450 RepID=A0A482MM89_9CAUD|nr:hypothetical protein H1O16_gp253 [Burkholderia phage BcepSaruman]YP_009904634.1 hypothetical protein H1O17_gp256 [Burkholderia phage BcepSauron]QBQ74636.1 hypothetical protein BcepSauron_256 [Burkholderia phage BcepSauron]QBX06666.1 hypothetical protein BcepSaruman_253 [Burkholderia phage BcepSaruman]
MSEQNYVPQSQTTSFSAFPADRQAELARIQANKMQSLAHLPMPVKMPDGTEHPGHPGGPRGPQHVGAAARQAARPTHMPQGPVLATIDPNLQMPASAPPAVRPGVAVHRQAEQQADAMFAAAAGGFTSPVPQPLPVPVPNTPPVAHAMVPQHQFHAAPIPTPQPMAPAPVAPNLVQAYVNQVATQHPGVINPVADSEYMSVELPSRFSYYGFTDLYVCPFRAKHLSKLQKAHREQSLLAMVEAVSAVCYTTSPEYAGRPMAFELTLPDFFFVLYWLRLNSFTKSNYVHNTVCEDKGHVKRVSYTLNAREFDEQVARGDMTAEERAQIAALALPPESLKLSQIITQTNMKVRELETKPDPAVYCLADAPELIMRPPTMRDVLEFAESPEMKDPEQRSEFSFLAQLATHIQHTAGYLTLRQRLDIVGECSADQVSLIKDFENQLKDYGVEERVRIQCKECGAVSETKLSLAAHSFFPS